MIAVPAKSLFPTEVPNFVSPDKTSALYRTLLRAFFPQFTNLVRIIVADVRPQCSIRHYFREHFIRVQGPKNLVHREQSRIRRRLANHAIRSTTVAVESF